MSSRVRVGLGGNDVVALDERPRTLTLVGGAIVIVAIVFQTRAMPPTRPEEEPVLPAPH
jgi:hypothetical protein